MQDALRTLARDPGLWNHLPLIPARFARECQRHEDRGPNTFSEDMIWRLWRAGFLRADIVESLHALEINGLELVHQDETFTYSDERRLQHMPKGWIGVLSKYRERPLGIRPSIHRYKFFVLWRFRKIIEPGIHPLQTILADGGLPRLAEEFQEELRSDTAVEGIRDTLHYWNSLCELTAACEPVAFPTLSSTVRATLPDSPETVRSRRDEYFGLLKSAFKKLGLEALEEWRQFLCRHAQLAEPNIRVQVLLRLAKYEHREKLRGNLGTAMLFLEMAEALRRVAERVFQCSLPEEDQMNYTTWMPGARKRIYGTHRVLDASRRESKQFLRYFGLDPGIKVRCYVEGATELGAMQAGVGRFAGVEILNLRGQIVQRGGRGLAFRQNLVMDMHEKVFSFVILDGDQDDNIRVIRRAVEDGSMFGEAHIFTPDFELGNFTLDELREVICRMAKENGARGIEVSGIRTGMETAKSTLELMRAARTVSGRLKGLKKDEEWGQRLINFAIEGWDLSKAFLERREFHRPVLTAINRIVRATVYHYDESRLQSRVDPGTMKLMARSSQ